MSCSRRRAALGVMLAALVGGSGTAAAAPLAPCSQDPGVRTLCGGLTVPLDRTGAVPGTVTLRLRALPPEDAGEPAGTILALAGGPGQAATPLLGDFEGILGPALRTRRLVVLDQRGTGGSGRLACPSLARAGETVAAVAQCAQELGPARVGYTTAASVEDVEAVRAALGAERLILYGTSYGTKVALAYAAAHPERVERLVLDSAVPPEGVDPFDRATLASIPRVLRALCARRACPFTSDPVGDVAALVRRLARAPLRGTALDGAGRPRGASLTRAGLLGMLLAGDFDRHLRAALPAAVRAALEGDAAPLLRLAARGGAPPASHADSDAVYVATTCEDGAVPWAPGTPPAERRAAVAAAAAAIPDASFAPFDRATIRSLGTADLCRGWPESPIAQPAPPLPSMPALLLSGDDDLRTPRADAVALARRLPGARLVTVPDTGHGVLFAAPTDCAERALAAFLAGQAPSGCARRARSVATLALPPRRLASLRPVPGAPTPRAARTLRAVLLTLDDASEQVVARVAAGQPVPVGGAIGGLRSGRLVAERRGLRLRAFGYVPGVTVDGFVPARGRSFTLAVRGRAAARGVLTLSAEGVAGTLDGRAVTATPRQLGWTTRRATAAAAAAG